MAPPFRGQIGSVFWPMSGALPDDTIGVNGDYAIDVGTWAIAGPKDNDTWVGVTFRNIPTGFNMTFVNAGLDTSYTPTGGNNGDVYIVSDNSGATGFWANNGGVWTQALVIQATPGGNSGGGGGGGDGGGGGV